jgi:competence protein ComEA
MSREPPQHAMWGWTVPVRAILAVAAAGLAMGLILVARPPGRPSADLPPLVVDANSAPAGVLSALPRLGPARSRAIIAARKQRPFQSLADFDHRVRGIGPVTAEALRPHLRFPDTH